MPPLARPCPPLFAEVSLCGFWWEQYGIGNARAIYIGRFRNSGVSAVPFEPDAVNCVSSFLTSMRSPFLPFRPGEMLLVDGAASGFVLSKPCLSRFLSDALNAADGDNGGCCALALEFVPGGSANTYGLTEVSHGEQGRNVHILRSMCEQIRAIVVFWPLQLKEQRSNMVKIMRLRKSAFALRTFFFFFF